MEPEIETKNQNIDEGVIITTYYFPIVTVILILVNIFAFFLTQAINFNVPKTDTQSIYQCLVDKHPECLHRATQSEAMDCYVSSGIKTGFSLDGSGDIAAACFYKMDLNCAADVQVSKQCFPERAFYLQFAFVPYLFGQAKYLWSIITAMFLHANIMHLLGNMIGLFLVGVFVETRIGRKKFVLLYFLVGIIANIIYFMFNEHSATPLIGASGAIFGLAAANLVLDFYRTKSDKVPHLFGVTFGGLSTRFIVFTFLIQIEAIAFSTNSNIAYLCHIGGFIAGLILIFLLKNKKDNYSPLPLK